MSNAAAVEKKALVEFLSQTSRSSHDISQRFDIPVEEVASVLSRLTSEDELFTFYSCGQELLYRFVRQEPVLSFGSRIWLYAKSSKSEVPYLWIQMSKGLEWKKIVVVPLSDLQWGSEHCHEEKIREYVEWIRTSPNVFCFLNGDIVENALPNSPGGSIFWQRSRPREQVNEVINLLAPIAHKILWAQPGNHEERSVKLADIDPLYWICKSLGGIPYYDQPLFANIIWNGNVFNFYCHHGVTSSRTEGGKLNAAARPILFTNFIMFYIMGHVHDEVANPIVRRCVVREFDASGILKSLRVVHRDQYVIIAPAWMEFWGSYSARAGYSPGAEGSIACILLANGGYEASG